MSIPKCKDFADYNKYPSEASPTTNAQMQEYMQNQNDLVKQTASMVWQPLTNYAEKQIIHSNSMPAGTVAVVTTSGQSGVTEPDWGANDTVTDGGVTWRMRNAFTDIDNRYTKVSNVSIAGGGVTVSGKIDNINRQSSLTLNELDFGHDTKIAARYDIEESYTAMSIGVSNTTDINMYTYYSEGQTYRSINLSYNPDISSNGREIATTKFVKDQNYATKTELNSKLDKNDVGDYIVSRGTSTDGTIWYRRWSSGWLEMGGYVTTSASSPFRALINFPVSFADDSDYFAMCSQSTSGTSGELSGTRCMKSDARSMYVGSNSRSTSVCWYAFGQGADEQ